MTTYPLQAWDVITHIGDHPIDNEGHVRVRDDVRLSFQYLDSGTSSKQPGPIDDLA